LFVNYLYNLLDLYADLPYAKAMKRDPSLHAVLTGDIVGSSRLTAEERRQLHSQFIEIAHQLERAFGKKILHKPEIVRGDSWQFAVARAQDALRVALFFRGLLRISLPDKVIDSRIAIGLGKIDFIPGGEITSGDGEAYRLSGEGLDSLKRPFRMGLFLPDRFKSNLMDAMDIIVKLIDREVGKWSPAQAESAAGALLGLTQQAIADDWVRRNITQQAVADHLDRAGWSAVEAGLTFYEHTLPAALSALDEQG
jgi:hypothetical protein